MNLLLDTHVFIWWDSDPKQMPSKVLDIISDSANDIYLSVASFWEIQIKVQMGKLEINSDLAGIIQRQMSENGFKVLPIETKHVLKLNDLSQGHKDPFDRMIGAQATEEKLIVLTKDPKIASLGVRRFGYN